MSETITAPAPTGEIEPAKHHLLEGASDLEMLPGELHPHPSPFQYVMIAVVRGRSAGAVPAHPAASTRTTAGATWRNVRFIMFNCSIEGQN